MIKFICDVCEREDIKENCFIFNDGRILCLPCFYKGQNKEVEIYKRNINKEFTYPEKITYPYHKKYHMTFEDFFILFDKTKTIPSNDYMPFKIEKLKDIWLDNCFQAIIILNGSCLYPNPTEFRVSYNPLYN